LLRDKHNDTKAQLVNVTNEREQMLDSFKTLKENCDDIEKRCRELKEKRSKLLAMKTQVIGATDDK
jgi:predicted nuclease with TOPRIM domain